MRLIDQDALIHRICEERDCVKLEHASDIGYHNGLNMAVSMILNAPTIKARPVVRGEWIEKPHADGFGGHYFLYHCSRCDTPYAKKRNFCNECGADLRGDGDETD